MKLRGQLGNCWTGRTHFKIFLPETMLTSAEITQQRVIWEVMLLSYNTERYQVNSYFILLSNLFAAHLMAEGNSEQFLIMVSHHQVEI